MIALKIEATSRTSRVGAVTLAQEFGYLEAEARAERFLNGKAFNVEIEEVDRFLIASWRKDYRVKVTEV